MKTKNLKLGNRSHNLWNVFLRGAAVVASVILLSFTVSAQELWKQILTYNSFGKMAIVMVNETESGTNETKVPTSLEVATVSFEDVYDGNLTLEPWMSDDELFETAGSLFQVEKEKPLELEEWMSNEACFNCIPPVKEEELKIEAWMTDENCWSSPKLEAAN